MTPPWKLPAIAATTTIILLVAVPAALATGHRGYDVSWPQCGESLPSDGAFAIVGVNGGKPYEDNPCLAEQYQWALSTTHQPAFYMNTANPGTASRVVDWYGQKAPNASCSRSDEAACAYNYGFNAAKKAFAYAQAETGAAGRHTWWLDVETTNSWSESKPLNVADIVGSIAYLRSQNVPVGVYSTTYQWGYITGGAQFPELPNWVAGARNAAEAAEWCTPESSFTGGPVTLIQWVEHDLDHNHLCRPLPTVAAPTTPAPDAIEQLLRDLGLDLNKILQDLGLTPS